MACRWTRTSGGPLNGVQNRVASIIVAPVASQSGWRRRCVNRPGRRRTGALALQRRSAAAATSSWHARSAAKARSRSKPIDTKEATWSSDGRTRWKRSSAGGGTEPGGGSSSIGVGRGGGRRRGAKAAPGIWAVPTVAAEAPHRTGRGSPLIDRTPRARPISNLGRRRAARPPGT